MIEMMLYLVPPHWTCLQFNLFTNRTFLDPFYHILSHSLPLLTPYDMAFKVLPIQKRTYEERTGTNGHRERTECQGSSLYPF